MSLWNVDDNTTFEFMSSFYRFLSEGMEKHEAFHEARIALRNKYPDPYYWAAFIMLD